MLLVILFAMLALIFAGGGVIWCAEKVHARGWLSPIALALLLTGAVVAFSGCATPTTPAPANAPREPEIFRPVNPRYPLPS